MRRFLNLLWLFAFGLGVWGVSTYYPAFKVMTRHYLYQLDHFELLPALGLAERKWAGPKPEAYKPPHEDDMNTFHTFQVGDLWFKMPQYYAMGWGPDADHARLRNMFDNRCIRKTHGECISRKLDMGLRTLRSSRHYKLGLDIDNTVQYLNETYFSDCKSPEDYEPDSRNRQRGDMCSYTFAYEGLLATFSFRTGAFPKSSMKIVQAKATRILDRYRIAPPLEGDKS